MRQARATNFAKADLSEALIEYSDLDRASFEEAVRCRAAVVAPDLASAVDAAAAATNAAAAAVPSSLSRRT